MTNASKQSYWNSKNIGKGLANIVEDEGTNISNKNKFNEKDWSSSESLNDIVIDNCKPSKKLKYRSKQSLTRKRSPKKRQVTQ